VKVSIITATTGDPLLADAVRSVLSQTHEDFTYTVVVDGADRAPAVSSVLQEFDDPRMSVVQLPHVTGEKHNGHRIYGAFTFLVPGEVIFFLDQDNWFAPDHVARILGAFSETRSDWV